MSMTTIEFDKVMENLNKKMFVTSEDVRGEEMIDLYTALNLVEEELSEVVDDEHDNGTD